MRINLITPFAEKDAVKALGARWDAAKKCWYIVDVVDLTPFSRWIPNMEAATKDASNGANQLAKSTSRAPINRSKGSATQSTLDVPHCGCNVLPWDDCPHTTATP